MPYFLSTVIVVGMMKSLLSSTGIVNQALIKLGILDTGIAFFAEPEWFRTLYISSALWQGVGYNSIIYLGAMANINTELYESATIDGAGHFRVLFSIILPLSKALLATFTLFSVVGYWNDYMSALLYLDSESKFPIQLFLRKILNSMRMDDIADYSLLTQLQRVNTSTVQNAAIIITIVPILCVYPFLQKHFAKGVLIGSVKG